MSSARAAVLVVEDDPDLRDWISSELTHRNFSVKAAASGRMALEVQARHRFDFALIDLRMPGMDGIETLTALKQVDPDLEAVIATGHGTIPAAVESMKQGAFDFIQKPFTLRQLLPLLERALEKSRVHGTLALREAGESLLTTHDEKALLDHAGAVAQRMLRASAVGIAVSRSGTVATYFDPRVAPTATEIDESLKGLVSSKPGLHAVESTPSVLINPLGSAIVVPLVARNESLGKIALYRGKENAPFTEEDVRRATLFSDQLAHALDDVRLHDELQSKVSEVMRTRDALIFAEKLALTGQLTAEVAHEINTPLTFVRFNLDFVVSTAEKLLQDLSVGVGREDSPLLASARASIDDLRSAATDARDGVKRIVSLVRDLNNFAQPTREEPGRLELAPVLDWAAKVVDGQIRARARLVREYEPSLAIIGSESRLCQVFVNLLTNAAHAIPLGHPDENRITLRLRSEGGQVIAEVSDTGSGMEPAVVERIFEPFFTTKPVGVGTGLGLPICRTIVTEHNGTLTVESTPRKGTTFRMTLPPADELTPPARSTIFRF